MGISDLRRQIDDVDLVDLEVLHLVARADVHALMQNQSWIGRHAAVHSIGRVRETIVEHLPTDIRPAVPK